MINSLSLSSVARLLRIDLRSWSFGGSLITLFTIAFALLWAFPLYWAFATSLTPDSETIQPTIHLFPEHPTLESYVFVLTHSNMGRWYLNSLVTSLAVTVLGVGLGAASGYAISQLNFPGRSLLFGAIIASFMVPIQALIVTHFVLMNQFGLINSLPGIVLPQLIAPIVVIVYKQFFDAIPKEIREAALLDGAGELKIFLRVYLPMNWGITAALSIITFIAAWNNFLWPFLVASESDMMPVTVGITQVHDTFGIAYARNLAGAMLAALPVATLYLLFQRRVTEAIMLTAGIKG